MLKRGFKTVSSTVSANPYTDFSPRGIRLLVKWMQQQYGSHEERGRFPTVLVAVAAVAIAVVVVFGLVLSYFSSRNSYYGYSGGWGMMGGFGGGFGMLFMIPIMLIVLVIIGYALWRGFGWGGGCCGGGHTGHYGHYASNEERETAMQILGRRYAKGEITKDQFEQMKRDITNIN
jgi:putative membrane protein